MNKELIPIITANYEPFRLISRGKQDTWNPTLDDINNRAYDYVKLHRLSTYLDVGIRPYSLGICFDGTLVLPAIKAFHDRVVALSIFNKVLVELLFGGIYCEAVHPADISYGTITLDGYTKNLSVGSGYSTSFHFSARTKHISAIDVIKLFEPQVIFVDDFNTAISKGKILRSGLGAISSEQILYGTTFYVRNQWTESLIHTWTMIEQIIEKIWQDQIVSTEERLTANRKNFLNDYRSWPVSTKIELLYQRKLMPMEVYQILDLVRKARNDLAHRCKLPSHEVASTAVKALFKVASLIISDFKLHDKFDHVISLLDQHANPNILPEKRQYALAEVKHWLPMPSIPGDNDWGDKQYEIIDEVCLKPLKNKEKYEKDLFE